MWTLAAHPDQWARLVADPTLAPTAVEECLRYQSAGPSAPRMVAEAFELDGYRLEAGTLLFLSTSSANHDPASSVGGFDITADRPPNLSFGGGPHHCLGAWLARAELEEALTALARAMPGLALSGEPAWNPSGGIVGPRSLPISFGS